MTAPPPPASRLAFSDPGSTDLASMSRHASASTTAASLAISVHRPGDELRGRGALRSRENERNSDDVNPTLRILKDRYSHDIAFVGGSPMSREPTDRIDQEETLAGTPNRTEVLACLAPLHDFGSRQLIRIE